MTDLRPAPELEDQPAIPAPDATFGVTDWLRWAWRQLTSMRIALILLFLLALGSVPGSMLPQQGTNAAGVAQYYTSHPTLAPLLNHLGMFNVFGAPWFAAIYLLLFASLVGCVVPRTFRLAGSARALPPRAPRNIGRLPQSASYQTALAPDDAFATAARVLGGHGFRLRHSASAPAASAPAASAPAASAPAASAPAASGPAAPAAPAAPGGPAALAREPGQTWISAEKGYLREVGNLLFHLSLLGVLVSIALGGLFGYKADKLIVAGNTFADTQSDLDEFYPGRLVTAADLAPFTLKLDSFNASYVNSGPQLGQPAAFNAQVSYSAHPGGPVKTDDIQVNHPLSVDGVKIYLIGHGYAPIFKVTGANGQVAYDGATPFISGTSGNFLSQGVVKAPDASPEQLGFSGVFVPTAVDVSGTLESVFPAADHPVVSLIAYGGNLKENSGPSQSVYALDMTGLKQLAAQPHVLNPGQTWKLPGGKGAITFVGYKQWASLTITHDPGQLPALVFGMGALGGLLLSFLVRRRRVFVRVAAAGDGSVVQFGGLARTDVSGGFEAEFATLAAELKAAHEQETGD
jgi:cytochrome c biogenesis protein